MEIVRYFPMVCIFLLLLGAILTAPIRSGHCTLEAALAIVGTTAVLSALTLWYLTAPGEMAAMNFAMGKFPAPYGNELRLGPLQALLTLAFSLVIFLSLLGGRKDLLLDVAPDKRGLYAMLVCLTLASLYVLTYTNDLFTGYVFIEISTMAGCALVAARDRGETLMATLRYLFLSLLGSGLFLIGVVLLYSVSGHLLLEPMGETVQSLLRERRYVLPLSVAAGLATAGLGVKSAMFPFHRWLREAHGTTTTASSAILSGTVLKGTTVLMILLFVRVLSLEGVRRMHLNDIVLAMGLFGMVFGSIAAIREGHAKRMLACSSVAQMGYIFMGIGIGTEAGLAAACFHILVHAFSKSMLFCCTGRLSSTCGHRKHLRELRGSAYRDLFAGFGYTVGALSMIGIPLLAGFTSKINFATASVKSAEGMAVTLAVIMLSTVLNAIYYIPAVTTIWSGREESGGCAEPDRSFAAAAAVSMAVILLLGIAYRPIMDVIVQGIALL